VAPLHECAPATIRTVLRALRLFVTILPLCALGVSGAQAAPAVVTWRLRHSDFLRYERTTVSVVGTQERHGGATIVTVQGHDLNGEGQYAPAAPVVGDLLHILALRLPPPGTRTSHVKFDWTPLETTKLRVKGEVGITQAGPRLVQLAGSYTFKSRGKASRTDRWWYESGSAETEVAFDLTEGVVRHARIEWRYERENMLTSGRGAARTSHGVYELRLKEVVRARPRDFQARVDTAIDRGLVHLRRLQQKDGTFKPQGSYRIGTTALGVLTLTACGVSREDPAVRQALDWIFEQDPKKTYDQATCLLAIDRAYTPEAELKAIAARHPIETYVRKLPAKRMAWVRRTAEALERNASSPGTWGYPSGSRSLLKFDTSNTQYAVLGLRAATHLGYAVREQTWLGVLRYCAIVMERKGPAGIVCLIRRGEGIPDEAKAHLQNLCKIAKVAGFRYSTLERHDHVDGALTCAAISCLVVARHQLQIAQSHKLTRKLKSQINDMLATAWAWLQASWRMDRHPHLASGSWYYYFLYSLERAAVLDAVKRVGGNDWYFEGAMQLLARQTREPDVDEPKEGDGDAGEQDSGKAAPNAKPADPKSKDGAWNRKGAHETAPTCFALLFLKRGTAPLSAPITSTGK